MFELMRVIKCSIENKKAQIDPRMRICLERDDKHLAALITEKEDDNGVHVFLKKLIFYNKYNSCGIMIFNSLITNLTINVINDLKFLSYFQ